MTTNEMFGQINAAEPVQKVALADRLLAQYKGDDKELIEPYVWEMIALDPVDPID